MAGAIRINLNGLNVGMDSRTLQRVRRLELQRYPHPIERANFEKLPLSELEKILFVANKVKQRRLKLKEPDIKSNPVKVQIKNVKDAFNVADGLVKASLEAESLDSGLVGEGVLVATYSKVAMEALNIQIEELNKEIKRKKEYIRVKYNAGAVDNLIDDSLPLDSQKSKLDS